MGLAREDKKTERPSAGAKAPYASPKLTVYGPVAAVTAGGASGKKEKGGGSRLF